MPDTHAETYGVDGARLADNLGQVLQFVRGPEAKLLRVTAMEEGFCIQSSDSHSLFLLGR